MRSRLRAGRKTAKTFALLILALTLLSSPTWGQDGTVSGTVTSEDGSLLPGALVSLQSADGSGAGNTTSDASGAFSITGIVVGTYTATATLDGFQDASQPVEMTASLRVTVALVLQPVIHAVTTVTAQRVDENILEVPMTISAFGSSSLEELVIQDQGDLQNHIPGLQFGNETTQSGQGTVIRGIGTRWAQFEQNDYAVATYVDGAYTLGVYGIAPGGGWDMDRIEVARGPQGTLNGKNSIAGSINLITKKPTNEWDGQLMTEMTDVSRQRYNAAVGGPLGKNLSFRLTGGKYTGDGLQENVGPGADQDAPEQTFLRAQGRFGTERFDMNVSFSDVDDGGIPRSEVFLSNVDTTSPTLFGDPNPYYLWATPNPSINPNCPPGTPGWECGDLKNKVRLNLAGRDDSQSEIVNLYASYQISDNLNVRYSFSDSDVVSFSFQDSDFTDRVPVAEDPNTLDHMFAADGGVPFENSSYELSFEYEEESHEVLLTSSNSGPFNWVGGLFTYENTREGVIDTFDLAVPFRFGSADYWAQQASPAFGFIEFNTCQEFLTNFLNPIFGVVLRDEESGLLWTCPEGDELTNLVNFLSRSRTETKAAFFSGTYQKDNWTLSGGLRYTEDERDQRVSDQFGHFVTDCTFGFLNPPFGVPCNITFIEGEGNPALATWDKTIGHISVEHATPAGHMVYGRVSTGFRSGGFNTGIPGSVPPEIEEETLVNYEVGTKGLFFDGRLQLAAGLWFNDFDGYQLRATQEPPPDSPAFLYRLGTESPLVEYTDNIDDTKIYGADIEFNYRNGPWRLSGFYAWQDSELGPHSSVILNDPDAEFGEWEYTEFGTNFVQTALYELPSDQTGNRLPQQPEHKLALTGGYSRSLGDSGGFLQLISTYAYTDDRFIDIGNLSIWEMPAYDRVDLSATWSSPGERWSVTIFGQNIFDEIGVIEYEPSGALGTLTNAREIGVQLRLRPFK